MIEIKNKLSNSKEKKKQIIFNKYMILKRKIRYKFIKFFPLTKKEKMIYKDIKSFHETPLKPDKGKYYVLNRRIHLLSVISKDELSNFCSGVENLFKNNPTKGIFRRTVIDDQLRERVLQYEGSSKNFGWSSLGFLTPKDENLKGIIDGMHILMFDYSSDYVGVSIELDFNENFTSQFNKQLIGNVEKEEAYYSYYVGEKNFISRNCKVEEILRKEKIDEILTEVKVRSYNFLSKYINLLPISDKSPISIDEYSTNYDYKEEKNQFLMYYDIYNYDYSGMLEIVYEKYKPQYEQEFKKETFCYNCMERKNDINRSAKLIIKTKEEYQDNFITQSDLVNFYIKTLQFYLTNELERLIAKERKMLSSLYSRKNKELYNNYNVISKEISRYKMLLDNISLDKYSDSYYDKELEKNLKYQINRKNRLFEKHNSIEKELSNSLTIKNFQSSTFLSKLSIWIAIVSIIITSIFSILTYYQDIQDKNIKANEKKEVNEKTKKEEQEKNETNQVTIE